MHVVLQLVHSNGALRYESSTLTACNTMMALCAIRLGVQYEWEITDDIDCFVFFLLSQF